MKFLQTFNFNFRKVFLLRERCHDFCEATTSAQTSKIEMNIRGKKIRKHGKILSARTGMQKNRGKAHVSKLNSC